MGNLVWILLAVEVLLLLVIIIAIFVAVLMLGKISKKMDKILETAKSTPVAETPKMKPADNVSQAKIERNKKPETNEPGGMIICPKCYNAVDMNSKICPSCQAALK